MRVALRSDSAAQTERADEQRRQGRLRNGEWEGRRASERARGGETGVARRRAGGTRRARGSSGERDHRDTQKKNNRKGGQDTQQGHAEEAGRERWGEQGANKGAKEHNVSHRETPCR